MHQFSELVLHWFDQFGRNDLPWQKNISPYSVWISEIMLQQTQVATVIPYFNRFIARFPNIVVLAQSSEDEVLSHWSGLGYYSRARYIYKTAQIIVHQYQGIFPQTVSLLEKLPGIGRSTAGAILSLSMGIRAAILDGNVKRVLARFHMVDGWVGLSKTQQTLWQLSDQYTPSERVADYTQAMMDLGAIICKRSHPNCLTCPLQKNCQAFQLSCQSLYPNKKPKKKKPERSITMLMLVNKLGEVLLEKRSSSGIWGGLWSFPEVDDFDIKNWQFHQWLNVFTVKNIDQWEVFRHTFTHYHLDITPVKLLVNQPLLMNDQQKWFNIEEVLSLALPAPITRLVNQLSVV